jgi:flagellar biosynthesis/type III secretory pathway protein FliH
MTILHARVVKAPVDSSAAPTLPRNIPAARCIKGPIVDARSLAAQIVQHARDEAAHLVADAKRTVDALTERATLEAREREVARMAAELLQMRAAEQTRAAKDLDRSIELACVLAERVLGEVIALAPTRINALAKEALAEARGARQIRIEASPADIPELEAMLNTHDDMPLATLEAVPELTRGSIIVRTELGDVDARLAPQLERLAEALAETLERRGPNSRALANER